jgi:hypothetical protein
MRAGRRALRLTRIVALAASFCLAGGAWMPTMGSTKTAQTRAGWRTPLLPLLSSDHKPTLQLAIDKLA